MSMLHVQHDDPAPQTVRLAACPADSFNVTPLYGAQASILDGSTDCQQ